MGFVINPDDPCVANKMMNVAQMTVTWYVDNLKVSHMNPQEVTKCCVALIKIYGKVITVTISKVHKCLGIYFDYSTDKEVKVTLIKYATYVGEMFGGHHKYSSFVCS